MTSNQNVKPVQSRIIVPGTGTENGGTSVQIRDSSMSIFYAEQLKYISPRAFDVKRKPMRARALVPTIGGVPRWAEDYEFRGQEDVGTANAGLGGDKSNGPLRVDIVGHKAHQGIVSRWISFIYSYEEIEAAMATGQNLKDGKMKAALRALEILLDYDISLGNAALGLKGALRLTGTTTVTARTKTGGGTNWSSATATSEEIAGDVLDLLNTVADATEEDDRKWQVVVPRAKFRILNEKTMGISDGRTILQWLRANCEQLADIKPWSRCLLAGGSLDATRMAAWPMDEEILGAVVPKEPELGKIVEGLTETEQVVSARCGGVVAHYPQMVSYMDSI